MDHLLGRRSPPVNITAGFQVDFADELALHASVAYAKRMSGIDLAEKVCGPLGEPIGILRSFIHRFKMSLQWLWEYPG